MNKMSNIKITCTSLLLGSALSLSAVAAQPSSDQGNAHQVSATPNETQVHTNDDSLRNLEAKSSDAWREGKLDTIYLFNRHLNNFTIDPEVDGNTVVLTGRVESQVDKDLAEQLARGLDGITHVTNRLSVVPSDDARREISEVNRSFIDKVEDATLTAEVKTKLLANAETSGLTIDVDTVAGNVTLNGTVASNAEKRLAKSIAEQVNGVHEVYNMLAVKS